jgi:hypothetical protein
VKLTTDLHLVPRSRMRGAIPPFPNTSSWRGAWLSTGKPLTLPNLLPCFQTPTIVHVQTLIRQNYLTTNCVIRMQVNLTSKSELNICSTFLQRRNVEASQRSLVYCSAQLVSVVTLQKMSRGYPNDVTANHLSLAQFV